MEVKAGSIVFFNGYLLHRSLPNHARAGFRRVLVNHYMSAESLLPWHPPAGGQTMGTADFRDIFMVTGEDPYAAWKPVTDVSGKSAVPMGEGGGAAPRHNVNPGAAMGATEGPPRMGGARMG